MRVPSQTIGMVRMDVLEPWIAREGATIEESRYNARYSYPWQHTAHR